MYESAASYLGERGCFVLVAAAAAVVMVVVVAVVVVVIIAYIVAAVVVVVVVGGGGIVVVVDVKLLSISGGVAPSSMEGDAIREGCLRQAWVLLRELRVRLRSVGLGRSKGWRWG